MVPELRKKPRCVPLASHERANKAWRDITSTKIKDPPQQVSLQAWLLYTLRYIFTGDLSDSWYAFGGLSAQLNHLSVALHLAVTENATLAIHYDRELRLHLQRLARSRDADVDFYQSLSEENTQIKRQVKTEMGKNRGNKTAKTTSSTKGKGKGGQPTTQNLPAITTQIPPKAVAPKHVPWRQNTVRQQDHSSPSDPREKGEKKGGK